MLTKNQILDVIKRTLAAYKTSILDKQYATREYVDDTRVAYVKSETECVSIDTSTMKDSFVDNSYTYQQDAVSYLEEGIEYHVEVNGVRYRCLCINNIPGKDIVYETIYVQGDGFSLTINNKLGYSNNKYSEDITKSTVVIELSDTLLQNPPIIKVIKMDIQYMPTYLMPKDLGILNSLGMNRIGKIGTGSVSLGYNNVANNDFSTALGVNTSATAPATLAHGGLCVASANYSHAEGYRTESSGMYSHAEGIMTLANGQGAHAEGFYTVASGQRSHAEGSYTLASSQYQHVEGKFNVEDKANKYAHIVGNGTSKTARKNAYTLDWNGNAWYQGSVYTGGTSQDDTNAKKLATEEYVDSSLPDASKYINERIVEKDIDASNPEYEAVAGTNNNKQYFYNFDITGKHSDTMAAICELSINTTTTSYITSAKIIENYETNNSSISLPTIRISDDSTGKEIGICYVGLRAAKTVNSEGGIVTTTGQYDSAFIQFARSTAHIENDTNNLYSKGFKLKVKFYDVSNKYAGDVYHIPYNLKNGSGSTIYQETCEAKDNVTNATVLGYKSVSTMGNSINIGYRCTANGTGIIVGADSTINSNASYLFGTGSTINRMYSMAVGIGLNIPAASSNKGSMILGVGGTLATDSSFAISTAKIGKNSSDCSDIRYPFEVKKDNTVYLRGSNLILETDNEPSQDNHLITKKYVDDANVEATDEEVDAMLLEVLGGDYSVQS